MIRNDAPVFVFETHVEAEAAIKRLLSSGFDARQLSLIGKGCHSEEHPVGFYTAGDRIKAWGGAGALWGGFWGLLFAPAVFFLPGLGLVAMAGPFVSLLVGVLEGAVLIGGVSAIGAALIQLGVPKDQVVQYENALTVDHYVLMVHGTDAEARRARVLLLEQRALEPAWPPTEARYGTSRSRWTFIAKASRRRLDPTRNNCRQPLRVPCGR